MELVSILFGVKENDASAEFSLFEKFLHDRELFFSGVAYDYVLMDIL